MALVHSLAERIEIDTAHGSVFLDTQRTAHTLRKLRAGGQKRDATMKDYKVKLCRLPCGSCNTRDASARPDCCG